MTTEISVMYGSEKVNPYIADRFYTNHGKQMVLL